MKFEIYFASSVKGPRRQKGEAVYLVQAHSGTEKQWRKMFQIRFEHENKDSSELLALSRALAYISMAAEFDHSTDIRICAGHGYVRSGYYWMRRWKMDGWKTAKGKTVKNLELWQTIDRETEGKIVNFVSPDPDIMQRVRDTAKAQPTGKSPVS